MLDHDITGRSVEVFDCVTGNTLAVCRQRLFETRRGVVARTYAIARRAALGVR